MALAPTSSSLLRTQVPPTGIFGQETINALGSVTGRLGYTADAALLYVKGGFAWANNKFLITDLDEHVL